MTLEQFKTLLEATVKDPSLQPKLDGTTYCNIAVRRVALAFGCEEFYDGMLANDMCKHLAVSSNFGRIDGETAAQQARVPSLVIAAHQYAEHGHVAVVYPAAEMYMSPSLKKEVPFLANVGKKNGILPESVDFPVAHGESIYYLYCKDENSLD